jgi:hypothetical protein
VSNIVEDGISYGTENVDNVDNLVDDTMFPHKDRLFSLFFLGITLLIKYEDVDGNCMRSQIVTKNVWRLLKHERKGKNGSQIAIPGILTLAIVPETPNPCGGADDELSFFTVWNMCSMCEYGRHYGLMCGCHGTWVSISLHSRVAACYAAGL